MATTVPGAMPIPSRPVRGNHPAGTVRTCDTTGLPVCATASQFVKLHAVAAVIFLLIGGVGAILLGLTRWPAKRASLKKSSSRHWSRPWRPPPSA